MIAEKDILAYCSRTLDYKVFALHDLLVQKRVKQATALLEEILENEKNPNAVLALIAGKFKLLYMAKSCMNAGYSRERAQKSIASQAGVHPYAAKIAIEQCSSRLLPGCRRSPNTTLA